LTSSGPSELQHSCECITSTFMSPGGVGRGVFVTGSTNPPDPHFNSRGNFAYNTLPGRTNFSRSSSRSDITTNIQGVVSPHRVVPPLGGSNLHLSHVRAGAPEVPICQQLPEHRVQETRAKTSSLRRKSRASNEALLTYSQVSQV